MLTLRSLPAQGSEGGAAPGLGTWRALWPRLQEPWAGEGAGVSPGEGQCGEGGALFCCASGGQSAVRWPPPDFPFPVPGHPATSPPQPSLHAFSSFLPQLLVQRASLNPADQWTWLCPWALPQPLAVPWPPAPSRRCKEEPLQLCAVDPWSSAQWTASLREEYHRPRAQAYTAS